MSNPIDERRKRFKRRSLALLCMAALAILWVGLVSHPRGDMLFDFLLSWSVLSGVFLVYRLNDSIDQDAGLQFSLKKYFSSPLNLIVAIQLVAGSIPFIYFYLDSYYLGTLAVSFFVGSIYSISFKSGEKQFRLKNVFFIKNLLIGSVWALLVPIGAGTIDSPCVWIFTIFVFQQVFIGSMIRDIPDYDRDKEAGVRSFPVVLGIGQTVLILQLLNLLSIGTAFLYGWDLSIFIIIAGVVLWRFFVLIFVRIAPNSFVWTQTANLFSCLLLLILVLLMSNHGLY